MINKGDAILRLLSEIKLELKEIKEQVEQSKAKETKIQSKNKHKP
ncbi:hypothetical protein [Bacillus cereus]|nr:hypothetical protein [Bacillus cereus]